MSDHPKAPSTPEAGEVDPAVAAAKAGNRQMILMIAGAVVGALILGVGVAALIRKLTQHDEPATSEPHASALHAPAGEHGKTPPVAEHIASAATHHADTPKPHTETKPASEPATEHAASTPADSKIEGHANTPEANMKIEAAQLKQDVAKLEHEMAAQAEMLSLSGEALQLKREIEALKQKKADLEGDKGKLIEGVRAIQSGEKQCKISGDPAKRLDELRACLGLSSQKTAGLQTKSTANPTEKPVVHHEGPHWAYMGDAGPEAWAKLVPEAKACREGKVQSPINLLGSFPKGAPILEYDYQPASLSIINNGHTVQVNVSEGGGVRVEGVQYSLLQFHFHTPSEEQINGRAFDMVLHFVHKSSGGKLLVIALPLQVGGESRSLKPIFDNLPAQESEALPLKAVKLDVGTLLPARPKYVAYAGSLTTPPCSEGVQWFVLREPMRISDKQFKKFIAIYNFNARPVQPVNGRKILEN